MDGFSERQREHHQHQLDFLSTSLSDLLAFEPQQVQQFDPMIGIQSRNASIVSISWMSFPPLSPISWPLNRQQVQFDPMMDTEISKAFHGLGFGV